MLKEAIAIRKLGGEERYELYDSDTGTSLGIHATREGAERRRQAIQTGDASITPGGTESDPGAG